MIETRAGGRADDIVDAMLSLLADHPWEEVTLRAIAKRAGISLAELAAEMPSRGAMLRAYTRRVDEAVLSADFDDMLGEPPRERLFDVLMNRLETLRPHRHAIGALVDAARKDTQLALYLNGMQLNSMRWMMEAASITPTGWQGRVALQGLSVTFARVLRVFVKEDDAGLPRTMAALDKELREAERRHKRFSRFFGDAVNATPAAGAADVEDAEFEEAPPAAASEPSPPPPASPPAPPASDPLAKPDSAPGDGPPEEGPGDTPPSTPPSTP